MNVCPRCQTRNEAGARFCVNCGAVLPAEAEQPSGARARARRLAATQPLTPPPGFVPRPTGALFADRFVATGRLASQPKQHVYAVTEAAPPAGPGLRQCVNPDCGAVHDAWEVAEQYCTHCAAPLGAERPALWLAEAPERNAFGSAFDISPRALVHAAVRAPVAAFAERVAGAQRFCLVTPVVEALPASPEHAHVWQWGIGLAEALDYLHAQGISFGGRVDAQHVALASAHAVWSDFSRCQFSANVPRDVRAADVRGLILLLYYWLTGKTQFALDHTLPLSANSLFSQMLAVSSTAGAAELARGLETVVGETTASASVDRISGRRTDVGRVRTLNEDSILALELAHLQHATNRTFGVYVVADGMGGHAGGEVASGIVVNEIARKALADLASGRAFEPGRERMAWVKAAVQHANHAVFDRRQAAGTDMGSTMVMALLTGDQAYLAHVGDSRAYLINGREIRRLTADHSLVERLVSAGQITRDEAQTHPQRNVIYRTMGDRPDVEADVARQVLAPGDRLLLCSDGLTGKLPDEEIRRIVMEQATSPQDACDRLVTAANRAGGDDNISVILIEVFKA